MIINPGNLNESFDMPNVERYKNIKEYCDRHGVTLVAVSKTKSARAVEALYKEGQLDFGENKVQELSSKASELPAEIRWHMIGHLQRNKVKYIAPFVHLIHSVDSLRLLKEIDKRAKAADRVLDCLFEIHIAKEPSKFGLSASGLRELLESDEFAGLEHVRICGLMGMASLTPDSESIRKEFRGLRKLFEEVREEYFRGDDYFKELSMGMTSDYRLAIEEGSTMVRIGSAIFGPRASANL